MNGLLQHQTINSIPHDCNYVLTNRGQLNGRPIIASEKVDLVVFEKTSSCERLHTERSVLKKGRPLHIQSTERVFHEKNRMLRENHGSEIELNPAGSKGLDDPD